MPKIRCLCNEIIDLSSIPNKQGFKLVWEPTIEEFVDELLSVHKQATSVDDFEKQAYKIFHQRKPEFPQVYECANCGRLVVFARASDSKPTFWFQQEQGEAKPLRSLVDISISN